MKRSREPEEHLSSPSSPSPAFANPVDTFAVHLLSREEDGRTDAVADADADVGLPSAKIASLDPDPDPDPDHGDADGAAEPAMICLLHRERVDFSSYGAYESHYNREHLNRCLECRRNFPSPFYLDLHADEWHDPFVAVKRDKGEHTYACFVEGCERKCGSAEKRRRHLIDKHSFPKNFFYAITQYGVDGRQSLLEDGRWRQQQQQQQQQQYHRRRRSSPPITKKDASRHQATGSLSDDAAAAATATSASASVQPAHGRDGQENSDVDEDGKDDEAGDTDSDERSDVEMDDLAGAMSAMTVVPRGVRFGRGGKVGFSRRS